MMSFLQTGKALYVLAVICFGGIFVRLAAGSFYKKLIKRKRKYGADQEPVFAELKTERRRYIQDQYGHE